MSRVMLCAAALAPILLGLAAGSARADVTAVQGEAFGHLASVSVFGGPPGGRGPTPPVTLAAMGSPLRTASATDQTVQYGPATSTFDPATANNTSSAATTIQADLGVVKTGPSTATRGANVAYSVTVSNDGPSAADAAAFSDSLPAGTSFVSLSQVSGPAASCTTPSVGTRGDVTCTWASLANGVGASFSLIVAVEAAAADDFTNTATVSTSTFDPATANNTSSVTTTIPLPACDAALSLVGCWRFGEASGTTALDSSPFGNHGTYVNGPMLGVPGAVAGDTAVELDGRDDHVRVPDHSSLDVGDSFTLEGWVKRDTDAKTHQLFNKGGQGFHLVVMDFFNGNQVWLRKAGSSTIVRTTGGAGVPADEHFHHVVATKTGADVAIYIDGVAQTLQNVSLAQVIQNTAFPLFFSATASGNPIDGVIDEYAVYDEPLTADEVQQRFQRGGTNNVTVHTAARSDSKSVRTSRRSAKTSRRSRANGGSACADLGKPDAGVTGIRRGGMSCGDAHQLIRGGDRAQRAAGMDCEIVDEDFTGPVVRITRECTGTSGRTLRYITRS